MSWKAQDSCDEILSNQLGEFHWDTTDIQPTLWYLDDEVVKGMLWIHSNEKNYDEVWDFGVAVTGNNMK